ncbi:hypothetical protein QYS36_06365 [Pseudomonas sp. G34]|uniref:hypothetical protein n=1 Tax=Pseudomonas sp. G34 TaxID=3059083 RepID=UPI002807A687|nr:hypothetical protein [Pseudomonas sp. G34]MDQ7984557.1 hypothetical protein [Pseudomonas sp. G34]
MRQLDATQALVFFAISVTGRDNGPLSPALYAARRPARDWGRADRRIKAARETRPAKTTMPPSRDEGIDQAARSPAELLDRDRADVSAGTQAG